MNTSFSLEIQASDAAFGDGSHPSTKGAVTALEALAAFRGFERGIDVGSGSGILALQMAYQFHIPVVATDIEASSVEVIRHNATHNKLAELITPIRADGYAHPTINERAPYDLICCNILAEPLVAYASDLSTHLADEGLAVLSGMLHWQSDQVIDAHQRCGLRLLQKISLEDWVTLLMQKTDGADET